MGTSAARIDRVRRRILREAVEENLDTIRGVPPRSLRTPTRRFTLWLRRASMVVVPVTLAGSTWFLSGLIAQNPAPAAAKAIVASAIPAAPAVPFLMPRSGGPAPLERVTSGAFPLAVRRVVLDAGHGGSDPGAIAEDLREKEITLDIGRRLRAMLEQDGYTVIETRSADETIALRDRAHLANGSQSDIFISIHVNALAKHTAARGIETYYLGPTSDPALTELATAENRISGYSMADMRRLLDRVYADSRGNESLQLARAIQDNLFDNLRHSDPELENWGVKQAPFLVLVATEMPAILAEVGCISNEHEAELLRQPEHRQRIAEALLAGIRAYAGAGDGAQKKGIERNG